MADIILVDFAGTLVRNEAIQKANELRTAVLQRAPPTTQEHAHNELLYANNAQKVEELTGLPPDAKVQSTTQSLERIELSGREIHNSIATTLFQIGMYQAAKKLGEDMYVPEMIKTLTELKERGYSLAIASGIRSDIVSGVLAITGIDLFDYVFGQPPQLGISNEEHLAEIKKLGEVAYIIGDKESDLQRGDTNTKTIFVDWGTPTGGEEEMADYTVSEAKSILDSVQ